MDGDLNAQQIGRLVLVGGLFLILVAMLIWAFNPSEEGGISFSAEGASIDEPAPAVPEPVEAPPGEDAAADAERDTAEPADGADDDAEPAGDPEPSPEPTEDDAEDEDDTDELIAAAPEPGETSVQVLDAGGGSSATRAAADAVEELGYRVVNVTSARANLTRTTIWFNDGHEDAALALQAREGRIVDLEDNQALSSGVDLHLLVGSDWSG